MPQLIAPAISALGGWLGASTAAGAFLVANAAAVASGVLFVGTMGLSAYQRRKAERRARDAYNASLQDRLVNIDTPLAPRELVLGRVRKGGHVFFRGSVGALKDTFVMCIALAAHEIDAVEEIYFNEEVIALDESGYVTTAPYSQTTVTSRTEQFSGYDASVSHTLAYTPVADSVTVTTGASSEESGTAVPFTLVGNVVTVAGDPGGATFTVNYQSSAYTSYARVTTHLGAADQTADARIIELFPDLWTSAHRARGVAYLVVELTYNESAFPTGVPNVTATIRGAKLADSRTGLTAWSENPAIMAAHVAAHANFGAHPLSGDEQDRFEAAANACDTSTVYTVDGTAQPARALYTAGLVAPYGTPARDVLDDLAQAMGGQWAYAQGQVHIRAATYTAPVVELDEQALAGAVRNLGDDQPRRSPISVTARRPMVDKFNTVSGVLSDEEQQYKVVPMPKVASAALITRDGTTLTQEIEFSCVTYGPQAQHIAGVMMRDARDPLVLSASWNMRAYRVELFDVVNVRLPQYGWEPKAFIVTQRSWSLDGLVRLTMKETSASIYTLDADFLPQGYAANTSLPRPWDIEPPTLTAISSGSGDAIVQGDGSVVPRVRVQWSAIADSSITTSGQVEVQWSLASDAPSWSSVFVAGVETQAFIVGAPSGSVILVRARTRNGLAVSGWGTQQSHTVVGDQIAPGAADTFWVLEQPGGVRQYGWEMASPPSDLAGFEVRYTTGTSALAWDAMLPLFAATAVERTREAGEPFGDDTYTFGIRAVDTSGNAGTVLSATAILDGGQYGALDLLVLPHQEAWPLGTRTNCSLVAGELVGAGAGSWSSWSGAWSDLTTWGSAASSTLTYDYPVIDRSSSAARVLRASGVATGTVAAQYRSSADNVTWTAWASLTTSPVTARYYQFRWTVTDSTPVLKRAQAVLYT